MSLENKTYESMIEDKKDALYKQCDLIMEKMYSDFRDQYQKAKNKDKRDRQIILLTYARDTINAIFFYIDNLPNLSDTIDLSELNDMILDVLSLVTQVNHEEGNISSCPDTLLFDVAYHGDEKDSPYLLLCEVLGDICDRITVYIKGVNVRIPMNGRSGRKFCDLTVKGDNVVNPRKVRKIGSIINDDEVSLQLEFE